MIREAGAGDLPGLLALYAQLDPGNPALDAVAAEAAFAAMLAQGSRVYVADTGMIAATCTLVVIANLTRGARPYALIENVVTDAGHRQRGLGRAVLDHAVAAAFADGCYKVMLMTGSKRPETLRFYAGAGFTQDKTGFQRRNPAC